MNTVVVLLWNTTSEDCGKSPAKRVGTKPMVYYGPVWTPLIYCYPWLFLSANGRNSRSRTTRTSQSLRFLPRCCFLHYVPRSLSIDWEPGRDMLLADCCMTFWKSSLEQEKWKLHSQPRVDCTTLQFQEVVWWTPLSWVASWMMRYPFQMSNDLGGKMRRTRFFKMWFTTNICLSLFIMIDITN